MSQKSDEQAEAEGGIIREDGPCGRLWHRQMPSKADQNISGWKYGSYTQRTYFTELYMMILI